MNNTKFAILSTIFSCLGGTDLKYSYISIDKIILLLSHHHKVLVKRRWVFKCLQDMEFTGYLTRQQRRGIYSDGTCWQKSSIIALTLKGARFLFSKRVIGAKSLVNKICEWVRNKTDRRFPDKRKLAPASVQMVADDKTKLSNMAYGLFSGVG